MAVIDNAHRSRNRPVHALALSLGYSPCPNDCFIFYALAHRRVATAPTVKVHLDDVEALNQLALQGVLDASKLSYHAAFLVSEEYVMLRSGGALGQGVGPLIVSRVPLRSLAGRRIAVPGRLTTANLLLQLSQPDTVPITMRYDQIMPAVAAGQVEAGLIIHESRFTYPHYGLIKHQDLGAWWEAETGLPLPLGGIMARRSLGRAVIERLDEAIRASLSYGYAHRAEAQPYIAAHAQELAATVMQQHIDLYVNDYTRDLGQTGKEAVTTLRRLGQARGLLPHNSAPLFWDD
ncbi:MAG: 1,4-dihydroxy-6-naphthoate synthase [Truepera sp.]|nr:1,4-dihydroxy-6-naphthoate synthase [Truepera sp.]